MPRKPKLSLRNTHRIVIIMATRHSLRMPNDDRYLPISKFPHAFAFQCAYYLRGFSHIFRFLASCVYCGRTPKTNNETRTCFSAGIRLQTALHDFSKSQTLLLVLLTPQFFHNFLDFYSAAALYVLRQIRSFVRPSHSGIMSK